MNTKQNKSKKILIVDDNPRNVEVVASLLSGQNYEIEFASSGEEGLEWTDSTSFDLILMDIMMPGMNGYEACRKIKEKNGYKDVPVIFLTAKTDTESLAKAFDAGGVDYVSKPFRPEELLARVATHLELKQRREELKELNAHLEEKVRERTRQLQEANTKLSIALKDLKQLDKTKTDFLHMVSHELRTPLNGILGGVELLKMHDFPEDIKEYLEILDVSTQRLEKFSYQALNISQLQTRGTEMLQMNKIILSDFVHVFVGEYVESGKIHPDRVEVITDSPQGVVIADNNYLRNALEIILENALQYAPDDFPVRIFIDEQPGKIVCTIKDNGPGFPAAMLEASLLSFSPGVEHLDQRTGLNLHFAQMIMHYFGGELQLSNAKEGGAIVKLTFPVYRETEKQT